MRNLDSNYMDMMMGRAYACLLGNIMFYAVLVGIAGVILGFFIPSLGIFMFLGAVIAGAGAFALSVIAFVIAQHLTRKDAK